MSARKREWEVYSTFSIKKRIEEMGEEPSWSDTKKYGDDKDQLMLNRTEQQSVKDAIEDLKKSPDQGKDLKALGLKSIRAANGKVRVHFIIDNIKRNIHIKEIEFRAKLYQPVNEYFLLIGDDLHLLNE